SGTPTAEGSYQFAVKAEIGGPFVTKQYTLSVRQPVAVTLPFGSPPRPAAEVGIRLAKSASATGGTGTYTWSLTSGALPAGVALDPGKGTVSGVPQLAGTFTFGVTATDAEGRTAAANATLGVAPKLAIKTLRLPQGELGHAYRARLVTAGGVQPLAWRV